MRSALLLLPFLVAFLSGHAQIADSSRREIKLQGAVNFRDIGGYPTKDGRHVKWGRIYRSDALNKLSDNDLKKLQGLSLMYVADFRGPYEVKAAPDRLPEGVARVSLPAGSEHVGDSGYMKDMIRQMASDSFLVKFYGNTAQWIFFLSGK